MATVVVVEDDVSLADMYQYRLKADGHTSVVAYDGLSGLQLIKKTMPDIVLLDLMLPNMSGDEVLRAMRKSDWGKDTRVLILTNISEYEAPAGLEELGIEGYLVKANYTPKQVMEIVEKILEGLSKAA